MATKKKADTKASAVRGDPELQKLEKMLREQEDALKREEELLRKAEADAKRRAEAEKRRKEIEDKISKLSTRRNELRARMQQVVVPDGTPASDKSGAGKPPVPPVKPPAPKTPTTPPNHNRQAKIFQVAILVGVILTFLLGTCNHFRSISAQERVVVLTAALEKAETERARLQGEAEKVPGLEKKVQEQDRTIAVLRAERDRLKEENSFLQRILDGVNELLAKCGLTQIEKPAANECRMEDIACPGWSECKNGRQHLTQCSIRKGATCEGGVTPRQKEREVWRTCGAAPSNPKPSTSPKPAPKPAPLPEKVEAKQDPIGEVITRHEEEKRVEVVQSPPPAAKIPPSPEIIEEERLTRSNPPSPPPAPKPEPPPPPAEVSVAPSIETTEEYIAPDLGTYEVRGVRLLPGCRLVVEKGAGVQHTFLAVNERKVLSTGSGTFLQAVESGPKYRLKLKHQDGIRAIFKLNWEGMKLISSFNDSSKETSFFFRITPGCSAIENAL